MRLAKKTRNVGLEGKIWKTRGLSVIWLNYEEKG